MANIALQLPRSDGGQPSALMAPGLSTSETPRDTSRALAVQALEALEASGPPNMPVGSDYMNAATPNVDIIDDLPDPHTPDINVLDVYPMPPSPMELVQNNIIDTRLYSDDLISSQGVKSVADLPESAPMLRNDSIQSQAAAKANQQIIDSSASNSESKANTLTSSSGRTTFMPAEGVSAMASYGIYVPVKVAPHAKRARSIDAADSEEKPAKKARRATSAPIEVQVPSAPPRKQSTKKAFTAINALDRIAPTTGPKVVKAAKPPAISNEARLEAVVVGRALPLSSKDASIASDIRFKRIEATISAKKGKIKKGSDPLMPEFFSMKGLDDESVRCAGCGSSADDGQKYVQCETCKIWQHTACMGNAVPKDLKHSAYYCQVCDPWAHRELLQKLRQQRKL